MEHVDVFVSGGGIAGLTAAAGFAAAGFSVALADPAPPPEDGADPAADLRSTAFLQPAQALFERLGLWPALAPEATPLNSLRVVDTTGTPPALRESRRFDASDLGPDPFGWNLINWRTRQALMRAIAAEGRVTLILGTGFQRMVTRTGEARITLQDGRRLTARLAVGADGRASPLRAAAGIDVALTRYGQKALAFSVSHPDPHGNVSTEIYNRGGAFTTVPLPDHQGRPASAIVWMNDGALAEDLAARSPEALGQAATERACGLLGPMTPISDVRVWPVVTQRARALTAERTALVAEAAHVLPPIGAQGLNTSLNDVAALLEAAEADPQALGTPKMLARYARARGTDIQARAHAIDLFNRVCRSGAAPVQALRRLGLRTVYDIAPLRRGIMRAGLGA